LNTEVSVEQIALIEPDVVIVCDNGLKALQFRFS
jgi:ABC-type Fe3+-hydroxamate transport system substrate-binding protein